MPPLFTVTQRSWGWMMQTGQPVAAPPHPPLGASNRAASYAKRQASAPNILIPNPGYLGRRPSLMRLPRFRRFCLISSLLPWQQRVIRVLPGAHYSRRRGQRFPAWPQHWRALRLPLSQGHGRGRLWHMSCYSSFCQIEILNTSGVCSDHATNGWRFLFDCLNIAECPGGGCASL